jgi:hypothetical protein
MRRVTISIRSRAFSAARAIDRFLGCHVHSKDVVPVDSNAGHAVANRFIDEPRASRLLMERNGDGVLVAGDDQNGWRFVRTGKCQAGMEIVFRSAAVAVVGDGDVFFFS